MGVRQRSRDQTAKCGMAHGKFSLSEESTLDQIQGENSEYWIFFQQPWHCSQRICTSRTQTVNHAFCKDVLERFPKRVQRVRTDTAGDRVPHHNNAPTHTALSIREFLAKKSIPVLPHPPYSPDLAPFNFCLFSKLKLKLKGHHFGTMEKKQKVVTAELHPLTENVFRY